MNTQEMTEVKLTPAQQALSDLWDEHVRNEFATKDAAGALNTRNAEANSVAAEATNVFEIGVICLFLLQGPTKEASACDAG